MHVCFLRCTFCVTLINVIKPQFITSITYSTNNKHQNTHPRMRLPCFSSLVGIYFIFLNAFQLAGALPKESKRTYKMVPRYKGLQSHLVQTIEKQDILAEYLYHFKPVGSLNVKFQPSGSPDEFSVELGNYISPLDSQDVPTVTFESFFPFDRAVTRDLYTIALTDLDPIYQKCHAIWTNIKLKEENFDFNTDNVGYSSTDGASDEDPIDSKGNVEVGKEFQYHFDLEGIKPLVPFAGPGPKPDTGVHRYVFLLFRQPYGKLPHEQLKYRERWGSLEVSNGVGDWGDYYGLQPLAFNFFTSSNEDDLF